jgi:hypothetical protein
MSGAVGHVCSAGAGATNPRSRVSVAMAEAGPSMHALWRNVRTVAPLNASLIFCLRWMDKARNYEALTQILIDRVVNDLNIHRSRPIQTFISLFGKVNWAQAMNIFQRWVSLWDRASQALRQVAILRGLISRTLCGIVRATSYSPVRSESGRYH